MNRNNALEQMDMPEQKALGRPMPWLQADPHPGTASRRRDPGSLLHSFTHSLDKYSLGFSRDRHSKQQQQKEVPHHGAYTLETLG